MISISTWDRRHEVIFDISDHTRRRIMADGNCSRSLMGRTWAEAITPDTQWYTMAVDQTIVGAIMIDSYIGQYNCHHICMLEEYKDIKTASILTQLAAMLSHIRGFKPFTTVSKDPKYNYMRKFLEGCGFESDTLQDVEALVDIYKLPTHWIPPSIPSFILHY